MKYDQKNTGPLKGIRVVDLSLLLPGPLCSMHLADLGAEVIKIENPRMPDLTRLMGAKLKKKDGSEGSTGLYYSINRNKKAITLNIKRPAGREVLLKLLEDADVLLEGFRPGAMAEMGIGYEQLKDKFPRLIYCAISGYGATGPYVNKAGHDGNYIAESGLLSITGVENGPPVLPGVQIADIAGGTYLAISGILAALFARSVTGRGQFVDTGMMDGAFSMLSIHAGELIASGNLAGRGKMQLSGGLANYNVYEVKGGRFVILGALEERFFRTFLRAIDKEDWLDSYDQEQLKEKLKDFFLSKTFEDLQPLFDHSECCLSPVLEPSEAFENRQLQERGLSVELEDPEYGKLSAIGSPFHLSENRVSYRNPPPEHGENTVEILKNIGYTEEQIEKLRGERAI